MTSATFSTSIEAQQAAALLEGYHFELGNHDARQWVSLWLEFYRPAWIRDAVIEALYQGRYKSVSVRQILELWQRRGKPIRHASHEFESAVCREFGEIKLLPPAATQLPAAAKQQRAATARSIRKIKHPVAAVSFDLSALPTIPGMAPPEQQSVSQTPAAGQAPERHHIDALPRHGFSHHSPNGHPPNTAQGRADYPVGRDRNNGQFNSQSNGQSAGHASNNSYTNGYASSQPKEPTHREIPSGETYSQNSSRISKLDNKAWRDFPKYAPTYSAASADEILQNQRQLNGVLQTSARAIQPFKPALPFSAKTLRLAKQQAQAMV